MMLVWFSANICGRSAPGLRKIYQKIFPNPIRFSEVDPVTKIVKDLADKIASLQDKNGCWNVLSSSDSHYPGLNYYAPNYRSTLWTLVLLADIQADPEDNRFHKPLSIIADHFLDRSSGIFTIGKSHFPIPCLNGNMLYLLSYFRSAQSPKIADVVGFFNRFQRFDDGTFRTPAGYPYFSNRSCYGKHTCYWGVVKLLKGLSHIPKKRRPASAHTLIMKCVDYILLHKVCYRSHVPGEFLHKRIQHLTFPNMYHSDFLEVLWLLKKEEVQAPELENALTLLKSKMSEENTWEIEKPNRNLIVPLGKTNHVNDFVTERAREVLEYYGRMAKK